MFGWVDAMNILDCLYLFYRLLSGSWSINPEGHLLMSGLNLILEFGIVAMILVGLQLNKRHDSKWHGNIMLIAIGLTIFSFFLAMAYSYIVFIVENASALIIISSIHGFFGVLTLILGGWLVASWAFLRESSSSYCENKIRTMRVVYAIWLTAISSGVIVYILHIVLNA